MYDSALSGHCTAEKLALTTLVASRAYVLPFCDLSTSTLDSVAFAFQLLCTMFSTRNSVLVSHSDGMFTRYSASINRASGDLQSDLIAFLSIVQRCNIDYLPITWQPALGNLGQGGSGIISQSTFTTDMPLAFKRFHESGDADQDFLPLISEVLILSQPPIESHPNIVTLKGICWEIKPKTEKAVPVMVLEKAECDLQQFMNVHEGRNMSIDGRLKICADIGNAIIALHTYGTRFHMAVAIQVRRFNKNTDVIHGDIKPQNVLIFKDTTGKTIVKVADFGYSTLAAGQSGSVFLPKSRPWNAPEHHFGEFKVSEAKKTDVYSFSMLCLWILFGNIHLPMDDAECMTEPILFDASTRSYTLLERLKEDDKVEHIAIKLMASTSLVGLNTERKVRLKEFFTLTISRNPEKRTLDMEKLVGLLSQRR